MDFLKIDDNSVLLQVSSNSEFACWWKGFFALSRGLGPSRCNHGCRPFLSTVWAQTTNNQKKRLLSERWINSCVVLIRLDIYSVAPLCTFPSGWRSISYCSNHVQGSLTAKLYHFTVFNSNICSLTQILSKVLEKGLLQSETCQSGFWVSNNWGRKYDIPGGVLGEPWCFSSASPPRIPLQPSATYGVNDVPTPLIGLKC